MSPGDKPAHEKLHFACPLFRGNQSQVDRDRRIGISGKVGAGGAGRNVVIDPECCIFLEYHAGERGPVGVDDRV